MELWGIISIIDLGLITILGLISFFLSHYIIEFIKAILKFSWETRYNKTRRELNKIKNRPLKGLLIFNSKSLFILVFIKFCLILIFNNLFADMYDLINNALNSIIIFTVWTMILIIISINFKLYKSKIKPHTKKNNSTFIDFFKKTITAKKRKILIRRTKYTVLFIINLIFLIWIIKIWRLDILINRLIESADAYATTKYIKAGIVFMLFFILARTILYISNHYINIYLSKKEKFFNEKAAKKIEISLAIIISLIGLTFSMNIVNNQSPIFLPLLKTTIVLLFFITLNYSIDVLVKMWSKSGHHKNDFIDPGVAVFLENFFKVISILITIFLILLIWGFSAELKDVLLSLSVVGVALGFVLKDSILNIVNGLSMIIDKDYNPGDIIKIKSGEIGTVKKIGLRSAKIKTFSNKLIILPNTDMATSKIINLTNPTKEIRVDLDLNVEYGTDIEKLNKIVLKCIEDEEHIIKHESAEVRFMKMGDYALEFKLLFFIDNYKNYYKTLNIMNRKVYNALQKAKIVIPFPVRTLKFNEQNLPWQKK